MSRKIRIPKAQITELPSPAWTFQLLTGRDPKCRLPGWVAQFETGAPSARDIWAQHSDALIEEATRNGFEAFWLHRRHPKGQAFERWAAQFIAAHRY